MLFISSFSRTTRLRPDRTRRRLIVLFKKGKTEHLYSAAHVQTNLKRSGSRCPHCALSVWLLPASSAAISGQSTSWSSGHDPSPGVHILSARLLQRAALPYHGQLVPASAVDPERGGASSDGHQATRPHLTVKQRVVFKLAILVFKSLLGETPSYLTDDCELIADSGRRRLRSADANALTVPRTYTRLRDRSFSVAGQKVWNSLPTTLRKLYI